MAVTKLKKESGWPDTGLTVDELWRTRRRRVLIRPHSSLKPSEGTFAGLKTEYRRRYRKNSAYFHALEEALKRGRIKPRDLLELEGPRIFSPEYRHFFISHQLPKTKYLRKRYTTLKPEGELTFSTESAQFTGQTSERPKLVRKGTNLKSEGEFEFVTEYSLLKGEPGERPTLIRTPTNLKPEGDFEFSTEYEQFKGEQGERTRILERRPTNLKLEGELDLTTEKSEQFKGEKGEKRTLERRGTTLKPDTSEEGMKRISETKEQFKTPGKGERADIIIQEATLHPEGDREFRPKYSEEFIAKESHRPSFVYPHDNLSASGPAKGDTETKAEYKEFPAQRPIVARHPDNLKPEGSLLETASELKSQYRDIHPTRPVIHRTHSNLKPGGEFERVTEKKAEFKDFRPTRPTIYRGVSNLKPEGEFAKSTEIRSEYKNYHPTRPVIYRTGSHLKPEGGFEYTTEKNSEYQDFHPSRPTIYRAKSNLKSEGDFTESTENKSEYKDYHPGRPKIHRVNSNLKPEGSFEGKSEIRSEYKDYHPGRPVLQRNNSLLKPEGDFERATENKAEYRDFHPGRPVIQRVNSQLRPEGDFCQTGSELRTEYRDLRPSRPVIYRPSSSLKPEGELYAFHDIDHEYAEYPSQRPIIYEHATHILPGNEFREGGKALRPKVRYEGEITIREERGRTAPGEERKVSFAPKHRRVPTAATLPRSKSRNKHGSSSSTESTTCSSAEGNPPFRLLVEPADDSRDKAFVVLDANNNSQVTENRWLRGNLRERNERWKASWALNPNTKEVPT